MRKGGAEKTVRRSQDQTPGDGASRVPRRPRRVPLPTSKPEMSGHLRASRPRSNAARIVFGGKTSKCLREEGGGQTGGRGRREELGVGVGLTVQLWDPCAQIGGDLALVVPLSDTWM